MEMRRVPLVKRDEKGKFQVGRAKLGGHPKGGRNRRTLLLQQAVLMAADNLCSYGRAATGWWTHTSALGTVPRQRERGLVARHV